jgi:hypothetical protein
MDLEAIVTDYPDFIKLVEDGAELVTSLGAGGIGGLIAVAPKLPGFLADFEKVIGDIEGNAVAKVLGPKMPPTGG